MSPGEYGEEVERLAQRFGVPARQLVCNSNYMLLILERLFERLDEIEAKMTTTEKAGG